MADRQVQEFWDKMWYWERYEKFSDEQIDDPDLVIILGGQVDDAQNAEQQSDPDMFRRFDACTGRLRAILSSKQAGRADKNLSSRAASTGSVSTC